MSSSELWGGGQKSDDVDVRLPNSHFFPFVRLFRSLFPRNLALIGRCALISFNVGCVPSCGRWLTCLPRRSPLYLYRPSFMLASQRVSMPSWLPSARRFQWVRVGARGAVELDIVIQERWQWHWYPSQSSFCTFSPLISFAILTV